jgi:hypothetical protein
MARRWALRFVWAAGIALAAPTATVPAFSATLDADCEADYDAKLRAARAALARNNQEAALRRLLEAETVLRRCEERGVRAPSLPEASEPSQSRVARPTGPASGAAGLTA